MFVRGRGGLSARLAIAMAMVTLVAAKADAQVVRVGIAKTKLATDYSEDLFAGLRDALRSGLKIADNNIGKGFSWGAAPTYRVQLDSVSNNDDLKNMPHRPPKVDLVFDLEQASRPDFFRLRVFEWKEVVNGQGHYSLVLSVEVKHQDIGSIGSHPGLVGHFNKLRARLSRSA
jgi:hypothetical protein